MSKTKPPYPAAFNVVMRRIRVGRVPLAPLPAGQWRYLLLSERI
jgi:16S rRNA U516 pseudouridylate synthase RsuA-like enzyme